VKEGGVCERRWGMWTKIGCVNEGGIPTFGGECGRRWGVLPRGEACARKWVM
jgi:hypothetical protein